MARHIHTTFASLTSLFSTANSLERRSRHDVARQLQLSQARKLHWLECPSVRHSLPHMGRRRGLVPGAGWPLSRLAMAAIFETRHIRNDSKGLPQDLRDLPSCPRAWHPVRMDGYVLHQQRKQRRANGKHQFYVQVVSKCCRMLCFPLRLALEDSLSGPCP